MDGKVNSLFDIPETHNLSQEFKNHNEIKRQTAGCLSWYLCVELEALITYGEY